MTAEMDRRRVATQKTLERYRGKTFDWSRGVTCVHLARFHLKNMGHKPPTLPRFRSALGAKKALKERGWTSVENMLDSLLPRLPAPAFMRLGDLAIVEGQDGLDCILVSAGPLKLMGWHPETGAFVVYDGGIDQVTGAWRV